MTIAVCFRCGTLKFGAFCPCPDCTATPETEDDLALSMVMTDHYFARPTLEQMGVHIKEGKPPHLHEQTREQVLASLRQSGIVEQLRRLRAGQPGADAGPADPAP
jgi:hypothetical protein